MRFAFNPKVWLLGVSWGEQGVTIALLCFAILFDAE
jgi:hypothetical protein